MPSNTTSNYNLSQWQADDKVLRTDFNADNAKIDAAIKQVTDTAALLSSGKADASALSSEVSTRTSQVNTINNTLAKKGNCRIYYTSYVGDGASTKSLTFPKLPRFAIVITESFYTFLVPGLPTVTSTNTIGTAASSTLTCSGNTMSWTFHASTNYKNNICNEKDTTYYVIAFLDAAI